MEVHNGDKFMITVLLFEFFGILSYEIFNNLYSGSNIPAFVYMLFMIVTLRVSGGHLNPSVTVGVYIEQREFKKNAGFALLIILVQFVGAFVGLGVAYMLRVTVPSPDDSSREIYVPDVYPFFPKIIDETNGLPAYGQVFLAETIGSLFFVMLFLTGKYEIARGSDPFAMIICIILGWVGIYTCFEGISGGIFNPAIAFAQIMWQCMTW
jgi:glycerol uptake facilitator-like aquaporin